MVKRATQTDLGEDVPPLAPAMMSLATDRQRAFVEALYDEDAPRKGAGLLIFAARKAGYGTGTSSNKSLSVIANRLVQDDAVKKAIAEYSRSLVRAIAPEAIRAVKEMLRAPRDKHRMKAAAAILDRIDPIETTHTLKIEDHRPPSAEVTQKVLDRIEELARRAGLHVLPPVIDGEFEVLPEQVV
jgi:hypothetical protein